MTQLSQEYFDKKLKESLKEAVAPLATKKDIKDAVEELARITNDGFGDILGRLDVRDRVLKLEGDMKSIKTALHLSSN